MVKAVDAPSPPSKYPEQTNECSFRGSSVAPSFKGGFLSWRGQPPQETAAILFFFQCKIMMATSCNKAALIHLALCYKIHKCEASYTLHNHNKKNLSRSCPVICERALYIQYFSCLSINKKFGRKFYTLCCMTIWHVYKVHFFFFFMDREILNVLKRKTVLPSLH